MEPFPTKINSSPAFQPQLKQHIEGNPHPTEIQGTTQEVAERSLRDLNADLELASPQRLVNSTITRSAPLQTIENVTKKLETIIDAWWQSKLPSANQQDSGNDDYSTLSVELSQWISFALRTKMKIESNEWDRKFADTIINAAWKFAIQVKEPQLALGFCEFFYDILPANSENKEDSVHRKSFEMLFGEEKIVLPGYYKALLARESPYFKSMFQGNFKETQTEDIRIGEVTLHDFKLLLNIFFEQALPEELEIEDLVRLIRNADRLELKSVVSMLLKTLLQAIKDLKNTPEHLQILHEIYTMLQPAGLIKNVSALQSTSEGIGEELQTAIMHYGLNCTRDLKSFADLQVYTEKHGKDILSLCLLDFCQNINDEQLGILAKNCPNLSVLVLQSFLITDQGLGYLKDLKGLTMLGLSFCKKLTDQGLEQLKELSCLKTLNLNFCTGLTQQGFVLLQPLVARGLKIEISRSL